MGEVEYLCRVLLFRKIYCLRNYILSLTYFPAKSKALIKNKSRACIFARLVCNTWLSFRQALNKWLKWVQLE